MTTPAPYSLNLPDVGTKSPPVSPCCYLAAHGVEGLHAIDCPNHDPNRCPTCLDNPELRP